VDVQKCESRELGARVESMRESVKVESALVESARVRERCDSAWCESRVRCISARVDSALVREIKV
jgi:hypothetical protein